MGKYYEKNYGHPKNNPKSINSNDFSNDTQNATVLPAQIQLAQVWKSYLEMKGPLYYQWALPTSLDILVLLSKSLVVIQKLLIKKLRLTTLTETTF